MAWLVPLAAYSGALPAHAGIDGQLTAGADVLAASSRRATARTGRHWRAHVSRGAPSSHAPSARLRRRVARAPVRAYVYRAGLLHGNKYRNGRVPYRNSRVLTADLSEQPCTALPGTALTTCERAKTLHPLQGVAGHPSAIATGRRLPGNRERARTANAEPPAPGLAPRHDCRTSGRDWPHVMTIGKEIGQKVLPPRPRLEATWNRRLVRLPEPLA